MTGTRARRGFTLAELLIAMVVGVVVLTTATGMMWKFRRTV